MGILLNSWSISPKRTKDDIDILEKRQASKYIKKGNDQLRDRKKDRMTINIKLPVDRRKEG